MLTLVPSLSLSAMVSTSSTAGNALLNGRAAGSVGTPAVAFYDAGERPTWPALLARGGTGVNMAASDVAEITPDALAADPMFFDESKAIAELGFAISEEELLLKAKEYLYYGQGVARPELLASDFVFMGPFVGGAGGLPRDEYLEAVGGFDLNAAFPDLNPRFHHFRLDPLDAGRVWFTSVASGTDSGSGFLGGKPTGKEFRTPPQACSLKFNAEGKVVKYTIGHVMERSIGNTGGLGGIFGPAYAIGKPLPFPEAKPWKPSKRYRLLQTVGNLASRLQKKQKKE